MSSIAPVTQTPAKKKQEARRIDQVVIKEFETQAVNSIVAGFMFASAVSWMDVTRYAISKLVKVNKDGGLYYVMTATFTTLLGIFVFIALKNLSPTVVKPSSPVYAVTGR